VLDLTTHQVPLDEAPHMYEVFQQKEDDCVKVVLKP
jgi:threonine dehydrogenase-like Zn-dependent dehydrogenase